LSYLLDTNVISEIRKEHKTHPNVSRWWSQVKENSVHLSVLLVGEIRKGIDLLHHRNDLAAAASLERWLNLLTHAYVDRIIPIDTAVAEEWGRMNVPNPISTIDGLMAATAKVHNLILVTRNEKDILHTGVQYINPFNFPGE